MARSYLPSFITEYFSSIEEHHCWSDWTDVFLSKGGSKEDPCKGYEEGGISEAEISSTHSLTRFQTMITCDDRIEIQPNLALDESDPDKRYLN